jgi:hypothetical protein
MNGVSVYLKVSLRSSQVMARLAFKNRSGRDIFIEKYNACAGGQIENNVFEIRTNGHVLDYKGMLAKRRRPIPEDYLVVPSGQTFGVEVDLTRAYAFPKGLGRYVARYSAVISYPDRDGIWSLASNSAPFRFSG